MSHQRVCIDQEYLEFAARELNHIKQRSYTYMQIQPGHRVLDVGCGPGTDTIPLAQLVGETGQIIGVDIDEDAIARANQLAAQSGVNSWVLHERANAESLPHGAGSFHSCRSERLFQHVASPETVLSEMLRVTKVGGWIVVLDADWGTMSIDTSEIEVERKLARFRAEQFVSNGYAGRQLYRLLRMHKLTNIVTEIFPTRMRSYTFARQAIRMDSTEDAALKAGIITMDELRNWRIGLETADSNDAFFASLNLVLVAGQTD